MIPPETGGAAHPLLRAALLVLAPPPSHSQAGQLALIASLHWTEAPCLPVHTHTRVGVVLVSYGSSLALDCTLIRLRDQAPAYLQHLTPTSIDSRPIEGGSHTYLTFTRHASSLSARVASVPAEALLTALGSREVPFLEASSSRGDQGQVVYLLGEHHLPDGPQKKAEV